MKIGVPKEIKIDEHRVAITPSSVRELVNHGHEVIIETDAGLGARFSNAEYMAAGAKVLASVEEVFNACELIVKVKEPQAHEISLLREGQCLFTYLHLAADPPKAHALMDTGAICFAYETVTEANGRLPLLSPMSAIAGRISVQVGMHLLQKDQGGPGILLSGMPGVPSAKVLILGAGVAGSNAAAIARGVGASVTLVDRAIAKLELVESRFGSELRTLYATPENIAAEIAQADLVVGAVLVPGAAAAKLINCGLLASMRPGSVLVDISIDQGGCCETSRPTTHSDPTYVVEGVTHYCVSNIPSAVARTSTVVLNNATLPYILTLADVGFKVATTQNPALRQGLNIFRGRVTHPIVAEAIGVDAVSPEDALAS